MRVGNRPGTWRNKKSFLTSYNKFCVDHNVNVFPADEWQLCRYALHTAEHVTAQGTVKNHVHGVKSLQGLAGFTAPVTYTPNLRIVLDGLKELLKSEGHSADPMTAEILQDIHTKVDMENSFQLCVYTGLVIGFCLLLRKSNLVPESQPKFNGKEQLTWDHVIVDDLTQLLLFNIEWSKMDPHGEDPGWFPVIPSEIEALNAFKIVKMHQETIQPDPTDPFLSFIDY